MINKPRNKKWYYLIAIIIILCLSVALFVIINSNNTSKKNDNQNEEQLTTQEETKPIEKEKDRFEGLTLVNDNRGIPVLYYHSVDPSEENEVIISPDRLKAELQYIKDSGYTTLTMKEANDYLLNNKPIPEKSILITFDDGYRDNYINAFPILKELDMKATIFVITNVIEDGYYLTADQIKEMSDYGIDIESHTASHLHLNKLPYEQQLEELKISKEKLESITGKPVLSVAYPFGDFNDNSVKAVKEAGYNLAFTTNLGTADRDDNHLTLDRVYVSSRYSIEKFKSRLLNLQK